MPTHADARRALDEIRAYKDLSALDTLSAYIDQQEERHDRKRAYFAGDEFISQAGERRRVVSIAADRQTVKYSTEGGMTFTILMKSFSEWVNKNGAIRLGQPARFVSTCG